MSAVEDAVVSGSSTWPDSGDDVAVSFEEEFVEDATASVLIAVVAVASEVSPLVGGETSLI